MPPRVNIAFYHRDLPEPGRKPGGVQVFVERLASALGERGHAVTIFTFAGGAEDRGYALRRIGPGWGRTGVLGSYVAPWLLNVRGFSPKAFDVVHLHGDDWFYLRRRLPSVRTFYGSAVFEAATATSWKRRANSSVVFGLELMAARRADAVYGIGADSRALYGADGILSFGVAPVARAAGRAPHPVVLFVGTWEGRKRGRMLRDAFLEHVRPRLPNAELWMVSDYAEEAPGVVWHRHPSDAALQELYGQAWTFCLPSTYEGLGLPYIEALAHGLPVVASPNPGAVDVLAGGRFGLLAEDRDLGPALVRSLEDDALRAELIAGSAQRSAEFAWPRLLDAYEAAYELAIGRFRDRHAPG